ncbi:MAG: cell division ATP-binding protein FtsE [Pseudomonadota bacterium]
MTKRKPDMISDFAVRLDGVALRYDSSEEILSGIDLTLATGSFTCLTGPSGAGKTSLLKLLYLALRPSRGEVSLFDRRTQTLDRKALSTMRRRIGVVFQEFRLLEHLTAYENAALPLRVAGQRETDYRPDVEELLRWVGLGPRLDARPEQLSGGEQQRVAIARALVNKPDLLIADEPTGNVDPEMGERLMRLFMELNRRLGTTVLIATHDLGLIRKVNAPVLRLQHGLLVRDVEYGAEAV